MKNNIGDIKFLGVNFTGVSSKIDILEIIFSRTESGRLKLIVTPNADHVVKLKQNDQEDLRRVYSAADYRICDSRVLARLANLVGLNIFTYPGSDIVKDMMTRAEAESYIIGIVGPSKADFIELCDLYPRLNFSYFPSAERMVIGEPSFSECAKSVAVGNWDILLICLGFPKQEFLFDAVLNNGRRHGIALCIGASVDFLIGKQKRAPLAVQRLSMEWAFRLISSPRRLWRRYILGLPALVRLYIVLEVWPRLCGGFQRP